MRTTALLVLVLGCASQRTGGLDQPDGDSATRGRGMPTAMGGAGSTVPDDAGGGAGGGGMDAGGVAGSSGAGGAGGTAGPDGPAPGYRLDISPLIYDFGSLPVGNTGQPVRFRITNAGRPVTHVELTLDGSGFSIPSGMAGCAGVNLTGGETCDLSITFSPKARGQTTAMMIAKTAEGAAAQASLLGTGIEAPSPPDGGTGGAECEALKRCCDMIVSPMIKVACLQNYAQLSQGGDAAGCTSATAQFRAAGVCK